MISLLSTLSLYILFLTILTSHALGSKYEEKDDETVIPIVLSIGGIIMLFCVIGCCNQGKMCCNKDKEAIPPELQGNTLGRTLVRHARRATPCTKMENGRLGCACRQSALPVQVTFLNEDPPRYSPNKSKVNNSNGYNAQQSNLHSKRLRPNHIR